MLLCRLRLQSDELSWNVVSRLQEEGSLQSSESRVMVSTTGIPKLIICALLGLFINNIITYVLSIIYNFFSV